MLYFYTLIFLCKSKFQTSIFYQILFKFINIGNGTKQYLNAILPILIYAAYRCEFEVGMGTGGRGAYSEGFWDTEEECGMQCIGIHRTSQHLARREINGAAYRIADGKCWCKRAMKIIRSSDTHIRSCFIENGKHVYNSG